ncbi:AAA family ATPase [Pectobacterium brasiliense]|nr:MULTISPECIES: AAA family ATPase [Pectobacterium]KGA21937.1 hypothetical protein KS44_21505 [Pectobacterium brasiliense]KRF63768.1 hypothetical protein AO825_20905 [Pectobacterium brasiliense]MBN3185560.1 AAA family ATPase [Pectobacterium brasiliense]MCA5919113.1 AAA family ATPase [Pectobacterium brasiliense]MCA5925558.1 AAA family ATPase [Pectobacterium brasiliense]
MSILSVNGVRSYRSSEPVVFDFSNPVTMIYGQNGAGKSTISGYFYRPNHPDFAGCSLIPPLDMRTLVFSQEYVTDIFSAPFQPGVFSLSEENAAVREEIAALDDEISRFRERIQTNESEHQEKNEMATRVRSQCEEAIKGCVAEIKKTSLWDLMEGVKQGPRLYQAIISHTDTVNTSTAELNAVFRQLQSSQGNRLSSLAELNMLLITKEEAALLALVLVPSGDSQLATAIAQLGNAEWVAAGRAWLTEDICPFCQNRVDAGHLRREITSLFDRSWEDKMIRLEAIASQIRIWLDNANLWRTQAQACTLIDVTDPVLLTLDALIQKWSGNLRLVESKISAPSEQIVLDDTLSEAENFNNAYVALAERITTHNHRADNYQTEYNQMGHRLRSHIRALSTDAISSHDAQLRELADASRELDRDRRVLQNRLQELLEQIRSLNAQIINCSDTVENINFGLEALGVNGFKIAIHDAALDSYRLERPDRGSDEGVFDTLSEGEKTLIAFLYFLETCEGRTSRDEHDVREKLIVIDDPISSLSQNYIFEIASLIQQRVIKSHIAARVIILTHSLFFFQEMLLSAQGKKDANGLPPGWLLYRVSKSIHSVASLISGNALLNDYQAMWHVLRESRDDLVASVVIPNTMRQILEYYFGFSGKHAKLSVMLDRLARERGEPGFQAFARYINRHSHADARNIRLLETASVMNYLAWFERVFEAVEDLEHYELMMGRDTA